MFKIVHFCIILYIFETFYIYRNIKCQPTLQSNIGRFCTMFRWNVEFQFAMIRKRYIIFGGKNINYNTICYTGSMLGYATSTHCHFGIGKLKSNPLRRQIFHYTILTKRQWFEKHPLNFDTFKYQLQLLSNKSTDFVRVHNGNDIKKYWTQSQIDAFTCTKTEMIIKGGGIGNYVKSIYNMHQSKDRLQVYLGIFIVHSCTFLYILKHFL